MKKNNLDERLMFAEFLSPMNFLLKLSATAYKKYLSNKIYLHALNIRKANEMIYKLVIEKVNYIPGSLQEECIALLNHYDSWMLQFKEEELSRKPSLKDEFIFERADEQVAFPGLAESKIFEAYNKARKQKK